MATIKKRLDDLHEAIAPQAELPWLAVYKQDDRLWIAELPDYRQCIGGKAGERDITEAELAELRGM